MSTSGTGSHDEKYCPHLRLENYDDLTHNECVGEKSTIQTQKTDEPAWAVWRQDDNGNVFLVRGGLTQSAASTLSLSLEGEGHKQTYWVKEEL